MSHIIDVHQLQVKLQNKAILSDVSFSLDAGEILGLVGPSGCGKTTLLNTLAGFIEQESGNIIIDNSVTITKDTQVPPEKRNVGMIFQDYALFPHLTVSKNVGFGIENTTYQAKQLRIKELLSLLELEGYDDRYPYQLSGGQQQRVAIARALAPQPKVLLLDEPFSNIDARLRNELMVEIRQLLKSLNMTAIFVTHNKDEVFTFADKIAVMNEGRILQVGSPIYVSQNPKNWQVADFLQLGSWLPVITKEQSVETALGLIDINTSTDLSDKRYLLIKPKTVEVSDTEQPNVVVNHIGMTEQGYHYIVNSINQDSELHFKRLSFYHEDVFSIGQKLSICIKPHQYMLF